MDILVVCKDLHQADVLYFQYINVYQIRTTPTERMRRECRILLTNKARFISEAQLEIAQQGMHNVKILSARDVQIGIMKALKRDR